MDYNCLKTGAARAPPPVQAQLRLCQVLKGDLGRPKRATAAAIAVMTALTAAAAVDDNGVAPTIGRVAAFLFDGGGGGDGDLGDGGQRRRRWLVIGRQRCPTGSGRATAIR